MRHVDLDAINLDFINCLAPTTLIALTKALTEAPTDEENTADIHIRESVLEKIKQINL